MICKKYARKTLSDILRHIRDARLHFEGPLRCGVDNYPSTLRTYKSLRQHMYEKHKSELKTTDNIDTPVQEGGILATNNLDTQNVVEHRDGDKMLEAHTDTPTGDCSDPIASPSFSGESQLITCEAAKFILKTLEGKKLTQSVTDDIIVDTNIFVECALDHLKQKLQDKLGERFEEIETVFREPEVRNPFQGLETKYQQENFFQQHFNYVVR